MFGFSPIKLLLVIAVIAIFLGPDKLPEVAKKLGHAWRSLKQLQQRVESEVRSVVPDLPSSQDIARFARSPVNLLNTLADKVTEDEPDLTETDEDDAPTIESSEESEARGPTFARPAPTPVTPPRTEPPPLAADPSLN
jgi:sec-independent protein translocase protein TatB